jgi:hypothetical protein
VHIYIYVCVIAFACIYIYIYKQFVFYAAYFKKTPSEKLVL